MATNQGVNRIDTPNRTERFQSIVDENRGRIGRLARVYAGEDAEDLAQEILMQIWRTLPTFDGHCKLSTWCYRIALNTAISWRRSATRQKRTTPEHRVPAETLTTNHSRSDEMKLLETFLHSLSEIDRAVLLMYLDDFTHDEIAESMGVSNGAVRTRISRIRERLENWEADDDQP